MSLIKPFHDDDYGDAEFGSHKLKDVPSDRAALIQLRRRMLYRVLNFKTVVAFVGAGFSRPLGYPGWHGFTEKLVLATRELSGDSLALEDTRRLARFRKRLRSKRFPGISSRDLIFMLGACQKIVKRQGHKAEKDLYSKLSGWFSPKRPQANKTRSKDFNPYLALMDLPIYRFVTSNYDSELEEALASKRNISRFELRLPTNNDRDEAHTGTPRVRSFTQARKYCANLALFAMARVDEAHNAVFHCHGRWDEPEDMVVSEADYQRWYLTEEPGEGGAFRQTVDLLFGSNPVLFLGFGMEDDDLLRPLRMFAARYSAQKASRPLFALLPLDQSESEENAAGNQARNWDYFDHLYERYGVHVIPFEPSDGPSESAWGHTWCRAIARINEMRVSWRSSALKKPKFKEVVPEERLDSGRPTFLRYKAATGEGTPEIGTDQLSRLERLLTTETRDAELPVRPKVIVLVGPGGSGKSFAALKLFDKLRKSQNPIFERFFFWSCYLADDSLTGLDHAIAFLTPPPSPRPPAPGADLNPRFARLKDGLTKQKALLVFDGLERLLRQSHDSNEGYAYTVVARQFLDAIADPASKSTVILTSRLWPLDLSTVRKGTYVRRTWKGTPPTHLSILTPGNQSDMSGHSLHTAREIRRDNRPGVYRHSAASLTKQDLERLLSGLNLEYDPSALCRLLDGHTYSACLCWALLKQKHDGERQQQFERLYHALSDTPSDRRSNRMIGEVLRHVDRESEGAASKLLGRLSVFMSPVPDQVLQVCWALDPKSSLEERGRVVQLLVSSLLLQKLELGSDRSANCYTVHPTVRSYVFQQIHQTGDDSLPNLSLPGFTAAGVEVYPGSGHSLQMVKDLLNKMLDECNEAYNQRKAENALLFCRAAFGLMRARMAAITASRWASYDEYLAMLIRLANLARKISPSRWDFAECDDAAAYTGDGPLYADELAWLYNEMGIACYAEGSTLDALTIWDQALEINHIIDGTSRPDSYVVQSLCNLGAANIEYGHLRLASRYLRAGLSASYRLNDRDHVGRFHGYLALVEHLHGNFVEAEELYQQALDEIGHDNARARSLFLFHQSNLKTRLGRLDEAENDALASKALADDAEYPDLVAYARSALGHVQRRKAKFSEAVLEYDSAMKEARKHGIRKLEADILSELSRLALQLGDGELAKKRAIEALKVANELVLGLRQTHGLVVLGKATVKVNERELGISYLRHAKSLADRQQYWLRGSEAEEELHRLGARMDSLTE